MARSTVKYSGLAIKGEFEPAMGEAVVDALTDSVFLWHKEIMPKRFRTGDSVTHTPRTKKYMLRKAKKKGHQKPLVYSGLSEQMAKMVVRVKVKASGKKRVDAQGIVGLPKYYYQRVKNTTRIDGKPTPDKFAELKSTTANERSQLNAEIAKGIPDNLKKRIGRTVRASV